MQLYHNCLGWYLNLHLVLKADRAYILYLLSKYGHPSAYIFTNIFYIIQWGCVIFHDFYAEVRRCSKTLISFHTIRIPKSQSQYLIYLPNERQETVLLKSYYVGTLDMHGIKCDKYIRKDSHCHTSFSLGFLLRREMKRENGNRTIPWQSGCDRIFKMKMKHHFVDKSDCWKEDVEGSTRNVTGKNSS